MHIDLNTPVVLGGTTKVIQNEFYDDGGSPFNLQGSTVYFTLTDYVNPLSTPVLRKQATVLSNGGSNNLASVTLLPTETLDLYGRYKYRFTVIGATKEIDGITGDLIIEICTDKESASV